MFDIGFSELLIVFVVMLLVVGPERLPVMARKIGIYIKKTKNAFNNIKRDVERELEVEALKAQLKENNIMDDVKNLNDDFQELTEQVNQTVSTEKIIPSIHSGKSKTPQERKPDSVERSDEPTRLVSDNESEGRAGKRDSANE